jgi:hypothetical protein
MEGLPKLKLMVHCDVRTRRIDGLRCFDGEGLVGEISLEELRKVYEDWREEIATQDVESRYGTSTI